MFGWTLKDFMPLLVLLIVFSFGIFVTRPNCNWLVNHQDEAEEKRGILARKFAFVGLFIVISSLIIVTIIKLFEGIE